MAFVCPDSHKHAATSTCYVHHRCRCKSCKHNRARYERIRRRYAGVDVWCSSLGTTRRLQALACIGWSSKQLAARLEGFTGSTLALIREGDQPEVKQSTARAIAALYEQLSMTPNMAPGHIQTRGWARKYGWVPPVAWDHIDNPHEQPKGVA